MIDIRIGDSRKLIHGLQDKSIDMVMTSPPYWGLRDYGHPNQIGLEKKPEEYLKTMLALFDDVKLKLKDEGNCFVNLGDTYGTQSGTMAQGGDYKSKTAKIEYNWLDKPMLKGESLTVKHKCLCMIPQRFAWGMIERNWILRNEIIWYKPNHMPESVTDRLTKAHEVIYHFVKQQKYYYNLDAIREPISTKENRPMGIIRSREWGYDGKYEGNKLHETFGSPRARTQRNRTNDGQIGNDTAMHWGENLKGKNPGDVWTINTQPYPESHFAVFPIELVRRPILAGCPIGGTVLDIFGGSGTVGEFCRHNERNAILFELNPEYKNLIEERTMSKTKELCEYVS